MDNQPDAPTPPNNNTPSQNTPAGVPQAPKLSLRPTPGASGTPAPAGTPPPSLSRPGAPAAASGTPPPSMTRPGAPTPATPRPAPSSPETKPEFKPSTPTAGVPPAPTFAKTPPGLHAAHAPVVGSAADIQMDFVDEEDNKEKLPFVLIDAVSLVASIAFAVMLFMQLFSLDGTK